MADELVLYTNPMSRGRIARWMLEEVGQPYRAEILEYAGAMKVARNIWRSTRWARCRRCSARRNDRHRRRRSAPILADVFPEAGLAPPSGSRLRGPYYRWLFFAAGPVEAANTNKALKRRRAGGAGQRWSATARQERSARRARGSAQPLRVHRGRPLHRRGRLCRIAHRLWHDVRCDRQAAGV